MEDARYICDSCREEFSFPVDLSAGTTQEVLETCPVCCHENSISLRMDEAGKLSVRGDLHING
ncbi:CPXCG motif-containing cysteine-rich protein [Planctomicrobium sp. SH661]|uniref:CPXCG motif-containing cysteine-rich protein n=1 Tax=Planctomicrobium sp. SH661 TaxID=3448124 RepID=UPI003F5BACFE